LFWEYDTRLGRRWNLDPVDQVSVSNYACFANSPIQYTDKLGNNPVDPRTGRPIDINLNRASVYSYSNRPSLKKVVDYELLENATSTILGQPVPRSRNTPDGLATVEKAPHEHETNFEHTSKGAFSALKAIFPDNVNVNMTGPSPDDRLWREAAQIGTYTFLSDRYSESEFLFSNQLDYDIYSVTDNYISQMVHLSRKNDNSEFNISAVTKFDIQKSEVKTTNEKNWLGKTKKVHFQILTVTETIQKYENNKPVGDPTTNIYKRIEKL